MLLKNCKLVDRTNLVDILVEDGRIAKIGMNIKYSGKIIEVDGRYLLPGMIDLHTHMREPGMTHKEDVESGSMACAVGGITTYIDMPNTNPATITKEALEEKRNLTKGRAHVNYGFNFGGSLDNNSNVIKDIKNVVATKVFLNISTGKMLVEDDSVLEDIFKASNMVMVHAEGEMVQKAIDLAKKHNKKLYLCHISQKSELEIIERERKEYSDIYVEVTPHHLFLNNEKVTNRLRMKPELKPVSDVEALWDALDRGVIDTIGTDHAPHTLEEKDSKITFGIPGVETALPLLLTAVNEGRLSMKKVVELYSKAPARIANIGNKGRVEVGYDADLIIVDETREYVLKNEDMVSKCRWTPFHGREVKGRVETTIVNGQIVYSIDSKDNFKNIIGREVVIGE